MNANIPFDRYVLFLSPCALSASKAEAPVLFKALSLAIGFPVHLTY